MVSHAAGMLEQTTAGEGEEVDSQYEDPLETSPPRLERLEVRDDSSESENRPPYGQGREQMNVDQENRGTVPGVGLNPWNWDESSGERNDRRTARGTSDDPELVPDYSSLQGWGQWPGGQPPVYGPPLTAPQGLPGEARGQERRLGGGQGWGTAGTSPPPGLGNEPQEGGREHVMQASPQ